MARMAVSVVALALCMSLASAQLVPQDAPGRAQKYAGPSAQMGPGTGNLRVHYLGTGNPAVWHEAVATGLLFQFGLAGNTTKNLIVDIGTGTIINLLALGIPYSELSELIISHLHSDHLADLATLYANGQARTKPLEVWGPSGPDERTGIKSAAQGVELFQYWDQLTKARINPGEWGLGSAGGTMQVYEFPYAVEKQLIYNRSNIAVYSSPVFHYDTPGAVALRIEFNGISVTYSGDCAPSDTLISLALWHGGSNVLMHEAVAPVSNWTLLTLPQKHIFTNHTSAFEVGEICSTVKPGLCAVNHLEMNAYAMVPIITQIRATYSGPLVVAQDQTLLDITPTTVVYRKFVAPTRSWAYQFSNAVFNMYGFSENPGPNANEVFLLGPVNSTDSTPSLPYASLSVAQIGLGLGPNGAGSPIPPYNPPGSAPVSSATVGK